MRHPFLAVRFDWDTEKNEWLKKERNISFEDIAMLLAVGQLCKTAAHPNPKKYPNQRVFLVPVDGYIFFVPFVIENDTVFLKTAFPHRKATRNYLKEINENK